MKRTGSGVAAIASAQRAKRGCKLCCAWSRSDTALRRYSAAYSDALNQLGHDKPGPGLKLVAGRALQAVRKYVTR